jgi:hypothetical protein
MNNGYMFSEVSSLTRKNIELLLKMIRGQATKLFSHIPQEDRIIPHDSEGNYNKRQLLSSILESKMYQ